MSTGIIRSGQNAGKSEFYSTNVIYSGDNDNDVQYLVEPTFQRTDITPKEITDVDVYAHDNHLCSKFTPPYLYSIEYWESTVSAKATGMCAVTIEKKEDGKSIVYNFDAASWREDELPYDTLKGNYDNWYRWLPLKLDGVMVGAISEVASAGYRNTFKIGGDFWVQDDDGAYAVSYVVRIENLEEIINPYIFSTVPKEHIHDDELSRHIGCYYLYRKCLLSEADSSTNPELYLDPDCTVLATYGDVCNMMPENIRILYLDQETHRYAWAIYFISSVSIQGEVWLRDTLFKPENVYTGIKQTNLSIVPSYRITPSEYRYNTRKHGSVYNDSCAWVDGSQPVWYDVNDRLIDMYTVWYCVSDSTEYIRTMSTPHTAYIPFEYYLDAEISVDSSYLFLEQKYDFRNTMRDGSLLTILIDDFITLYSNDVSGGSDRSLLYSDPDCTNIVGDYGRLEMGYGAFITTIVLYDIEIDSSLDGRSTHISITRDKNKTLDDVIDETVRDLITHGAYDDRYITVSKYTSMLDDPASMPLPPPNFVVNDLENPPDCGYVMSFNLIGSGGPVLVYASMRTPGSAKPLLFDEPK